MGVREKGDEIDAGEQDTCHDHPEDQIDGIGHARRRLVVAAALWRVVVEIHGGVRMK